MLNLTGIIQAVVLPSDTDATRRAGSQRIPVISRRLSFGCPQETLSRTGEQPPNMDQLRNSESIAVLRSVMLFRLPRVRKGRDRDHGLVGVDRGGGSPADGSANDDAASGHAVIGTRNSCELARL